MAGCPHTIIKVECSDARTVIRRATTNTIEQKPAEEKLNLINHKVKPARKATFCPNPGKGRFSKPFETITSFPTASRRAGDDATETEQEHQELLDCDAVSATVAKRIELQEKGAEMQFKRVTRQKTKTRRWAILCPRTRR